MNLVIHDLKDHMNDMDPLADILTEAPAVKKYEERYTGTT